MDAVATIRSLVVPVYLPAFLTQISNGMMVLILPLYMESLGLSATEIGAVVAVAGVGGVLAQAPVGTMIAKRTARLVILVAVASMAATLAAFVLVEGTYWFGASRLIWGAGSAGWLIGLQTRMTRATTSETRGRAMSSWGGMMRGAVFIGPLLGGWAIDVWGYETAILIAAALMTSSMIPIARSKPLPAPLINVKNVGLPTLQAVRPHLRLVLSVGIAHSCTIAARSGRFLIIPLIGSAQGLSATEIGSLVAIGSLADFALFPLAGYLMDHHGRLFAIVPAFSGFAVGMVMLGLAASPVAVTIAVVTIGVSNGIGSGTMLTLSSDLAPPDATSQFLASVGSIRDIGKIVGPLLVGWLIDVLDYDASAYSLAALSLIGLSIIVFVIGETQSREPHQS